MSDRAQLRRTAQSSFWRCWRTDVTDWVGGYPYEFATVQEIFDFVRQTFPDFLLEGLKSTRGLGTNWFLFRRTGGGM